MPKRKSDAVSDSADVTSESKKAKKLQEDQLKKFLTFAEEEDTLIAGLTYFLTAVERDGGEAFLDTYLRKHPECTHLVQPLSWDKQKRNRDVLLVSFGCLEQVLLYTASVESDPVLTSVGLQLTQNMLSTHMRTIYSSLVTTAPARLIGTCLGLLSAMVTQGPAAAKEVLLGFNFGYKPLSFLLSKTDRIKERQDSVRSSLIKFALSFLMVGTGDTISTILETKGFLSSIFGLLAKDSSDIVYLVLSAVKHKVVFNASVSKKAKSRFFSHGVLKGLSQLLSREDDLIITADDESDDAKSVSTTIKQLTFDLMLPLLTDFHHGIPYRPKEAPPAGLLRTNNPGLLHATLILSGSLQNQLAKDLVLASISTCPDILLSFLKQASVPLELKPVSKWLIGIQFLNELFDRLPAVCDLTTPLLPHLDVAVSVTIPSVTSRAMLSQWIQSPVLLVKHGVLQLLGSVLNRASAMITTTRDAAFCQKYSDTLLKNLPDIKTIISLRQQLVSKKQLGTVDADGSGLTPEQGTKTEELAKDNTLLSLTTVVMRGYQTLCPSLYSQVEFGLHRLLPPLNASQQLEEDSPLLAREVLLPSLQLLFDAPQDGTKHLECTVLKTLMLLLIQKEDVSTLASDLLIKLLSAVEGLNGMEMELKLILKAMVDQKTYLVLPEAVDFLVDSFLSFAQGSCVYAESVEDVLSGGERSSRKEHELQLLNKILAAPLDAEIDDCDSSQMDRLKCKDPLFPLMYCFLTKFTALEPGTLILFVSEVVMELLLIRDDYQSFVAVVLCCLCTDEFSAKCEGSTWKNLVVSLVGHLTSWYPDCHQVKDRVPFGEVKQLSHKTLQKRLDEQSLLPLLSQATESQLVSLFSSETELDDNLLTLARNLCAVRPVKGLFGTPGDGSDSMLLLLPHLSFASIITQSISGAGDQSISGAGDPSLPLQHTSISQKFVGMLSVPAIVHHLQEKIKKESSDAHLCLYNEHVALSLFNKLDFWLCGTDCPNGRGALDACVSLLAVIFQCKPVPKGKPPSCNSVGHSFLLDALSKKLTLDTVQTLKNWTGKHKDKERGRTLVTLLNTLKHHMSGSCVQELFKVLVKSLTSQHPLPAVVVNMLEALLCADVDLVPDADVLRDLLYAVVQMKSQKLDVVLLSLLGEKHRHRILYSSEEMQCAAHVTGHNLLPSHAEGSCDRCAVARLGAMLKKLLPTLEAKNIMRGEELLCTLMVQAPRSSVCITVPMQKSILDYCLESPDHIKAEIAILLLQHSSAACEVLREEGWCERVCQAIVEGEGEALCDQLLVMESYLKGATCDVDQSLNVLSETIRKRLWKRCLALLADLQCSQKLVLSCQSILQLICLPALQGDHEKFLQRIKRVARQMEWKTTASAAFMTCIGAQLSAAVCKVALPPGVWNDFAVDVIRNHFNCFDLVHLIATLVTKVYVDGDGAGYLPLEEFSEIIWSHPSFSKIMFANNNSDAEVLKAKEGLIELLVAVLELCPSLCSAVHVETVLGAYHASTTKADRGLLYLLYLCEVNGVSLEQYRPFLWGACALEHYKARQDLGLLLWKQPGPQEVLDLVDRELLQLSSHHFPLETELEPTDPYAKVEPQQEVVDQPKDAIYGQPKDGIYGQPKDGIYDPSFFLPVLSHLLDSSNYLDCRKFVDVGFLGYLLASLCSRNSSVRMAGRHALSRFSTHLEGASFREKAQIAMMFDVMKNSLEDNNTRLPSFFASFLPTVAHILMHPDHHLYRAIAYHLASKPTLDVGDIPLYRTFMHSSSDQHHQERAWILRILVEGLRCAEDYAIFRRRRVLSQAMALYHLSNTTKEVRGLILQLLYKACCIPLVAIDLVWNLGVLPWLQQVSLSGAGEKVVYVEMIQSLWKCLKVEALPSPPAQAEELVSHEKQVKRPPLLEEELVLTLAATLLKC